MNRISRPSEAEAAEALLEAGRTEPVLHYDVESGLARHHDWLRNEAPLPEWASAGLGLGAKPLVPIAIKTIVSAVLIGALGVAGWQVLDRPQPSAAGVQPSLPVAERTLAVASSVQDVPASEPWMGPKPIPVPDHGLASDHQPVRRAVRADAPDKRTTRFQRAHKESASARATSAPVVPQTEPSDETPARVESAAPATAQPTRDVSAAGAPRNEVAAAPEGKTSSAAQKARPEPGSQAQVPNDLVEMQQVATAERLLERSPERALALVRQGDQRFAGGYFRQERAYIATMALIRLGRIQEARARAASFAKQFPALPYGARIRSALEAHEATAPRAASRDAVP